MTTKRRKPLPVEDRVRLVYDVFDEIASRELGDEMRDLAVTEEVIEEIVDEVAWAFPRRVEARKSIPSILSPSRSPHVDWIAVEKAVGFDWDAFEALTDLERGLVADRLAAVDNPTDAPPSNGIHRSAHGIASAYQPTKTRMAYMRGTEKQRDRMLSLIDRRGRAQAAAA